LDEDVDPDLYAARALKPPSGDTNRLNYRLIAEIYQRLKKNYDEHRDYWTAGDFHYSELEMKRLYSPHPNRVLRWLHRTLGLVAWYKYGSEYGESYVRPGLCLVLVLVLYAFLYPLAGLHFDADGSATPRATSACAGSLTYLCPWQGTDRSLPVWSARRKLLADAAMTSLYVAAFQKDPTYQPNYPWGRLLAMSEVLLSSTLGALFLLAVRRQFKR